jgi:hypothetical protein
MPTNQSSSMPYPSNSHFPERQLFTPFLSTIYTEIVTQWFKEEWLIFPDNHKETFLTLNSDIKDYLTAQMAIDNNSFVNTKLPLLNQPECLLIRTERNHKSLLLPNSIISLKPLLDTKKSSQGKLIAIICNSLETNSKLMFYKHSPKNQWYIFYDNQFISSSNLLSNEDQYQLESILEQNSNTNFIHPSQLSFPLSTLCNHPIIYVYLINGAN